MRSEAFFAPLKIWRRTGTVGGSKGTPFTVKRKRERF
jgi:hypothetical protein